MAQRPVDPPALLLTSRRQGARTLRFNATATSLVLLVSDLLAVTASTAAASWLLTLFGDAPTPSHLTLGLTLVILLPFAFALARLYPGTVHGEVEELRRQTLATTYLFTGLLAGLALADRSQLDFGALAGALTLFAAPFFRATFRELAKGAPWWGIPAVVIGEDERTGDLSRLLEKKPHLGFREVARIGTGHDGSYASADSLEQALESLERYAAQGIRTVIFTSNRAWEAALLREIVERGLRLPSILLLQDRHALGPLSNRAMSVGEFRGTHLRQELLVPGNLALKRCMDICLVLPFALVALPLVALAALAIMVVSPGNPFYYQKREGEGGRYFKVWKLRTMYLDAERRLELYLASHPEARAQWDRSYKLDDDPRILPLVGDLLRRSSIDELPQLLNIIVGQMSLVGPRPFPEYHLAAFGSSFRARRRRVKPGLTGLWQVEARSDSDLELQEELDSRYIADWTPWLDIYLLARTPLAVFKGKGAR